MKAQLVQMMSKPGRRKRRFENVLEKFYAVRYVILVQILMNIELMMILLEMKSALVWKLERPSKTFLAQILTVTKNNSWISICGLTFYYFDFILFA